MCGSYTPRCGQCPKSANVLISLYLEREKAKKKKNTTCVLCPPNQSLQPWAHHSSQLQNRTVCSIWWPMESLQENGDNTHHFSYNMTLRHWPLSLLHILLKRSALSLQICTGYGSSLTNKIVLHSQDRYQQIIINGIRSSVLPELNNKVLIYLGRGDSRSDFPFFIASRISW